MLGAGFLALQPERLRPATRLTRALRDGASLGRPLVEVKPEGDTYWRVVAHEGRGRCKAIAEVFGPDTEVEVWVWPRGGLRRRHLTDEDLERTLLPDMRRAWLQWTTVHPNPGAPPGPP